MKQLHSMTEIEVQNSILQYLKFKKISAWRNNNGSVYDAKRGTHRSKNKWEKICGDPVDILGVLPDGRFLAIEVKKDSKGKPSPGQANFLEIICENGGVGFVAFSIECVKNELELK
jgi:hypothetical protein